MHHTWYIKVILKNGEYIFGKTEENFTSSGDVAKKIMNISEGNFAAIRSEDDNTQIFFKIEEVVAIFVGIESLQKQ